MALEIEGQAWQATDPKKHIEFIRRISAEHPEWGEDRIGLELKLKLMVDHSPSTIRRYMVEFSPPRSSTWKQFLTSHADQILSIDLTIKPLWNYTVSDVFVVLALGSREIIHIAVTSNPTLDWVKQQLREATAWGRTPRFLVHDNDGIWRSQVTWAFGSGQYRWRARQPGFCKTYRCALDQWLAETLGVVGIPTPYGAPNAAAHIERFIGSLRRECLVHFVFLHEGHLRRTATEYATWHNTARVHQGINDIPDVVAGTIPPRRPPPVDASRLVGHPVLGGLAHDYELAA